MIGAEGGTRTRTLLRGTNFKNVARLLTSLYYALPSSIYRRFSRQSKLRLAWYRHVPPHLPLMLLGLTPHRSRLNPAPPTDALDNKVAECKMSTTSVRWMCTSRRSRRLRLMLGNEAYLHARSALRSVNPWHERRN